MSNLKGKSVPQLLALHVDIMEELRERNVVRSANNPTGDYAEYLFRKAYGWTLEHNSAKAFDATDNDGKRYQIKGRRIHKRNGSRQLSAIRDLDGFHVLAGVLFQHDFAVKRAALIPVEIVRQESSPDRHTNSHRFLLRDRIWTLPGVTDVTDCLALAAAS